MTTRKREKMIKEIVDQEFGPNLTVDEICEGIDFSQRNGVRLTDPLKKKPFFKRPLVLTLANICLILICVLSTFFIMKNDICIIDNYTKITNVLDEEEIKYLEDNEYKFKDYIDQMIVLDGEINLYTIIVKKNNKYQCFIKLINIENSEPELTIIRNNNSYILTNINDFINVGELNTENEINLSINYKNIINEYNFQYNPY